VSADEGNVAESKEWKFTWFCRFALDSETTPKRARRSGTRDDLKAAPTRSAFNCARCKSTQSSVQIRRASRTSSRPTPSRATLRVDVFSFDLKRFRALLQLVCSALRNLLHGAWRDSGPPL